MAATAVNARWQTEMAEFFVELEDSRPDTGFLRLERGLPPGGPAGRSGTRHRDERPDMTSFNEISGRLESLAIEVPSWAYGNSGTRFKVFGTPGTPAQPSTRRSTTPRRCTGSPVLAPTVALHIPWDRVDDYAELARLRRGPGSRARHDQPQHLPGRRLQARQPDQPGPDGSGARPFEHLLDCVEVMDATGSRDLKLWFADGTNYPGQDDIRARQDRLAEALAAIYAQLADDQRLVLEYKFFEPAFYPTDVPDWGTSYAHCRGPGRQGAGRASTPATTRRAPTSSSSWPCCCASGSSAPSTSTAASTPTTTSWSAPPTRSSCSGSCIEIVRGGGFGPDSDVALHARPVPQHRAEDPGQIRSVLNVQEATAKALLVDADALAVGPAPRATCSAPTRSSWTRSTPTYGRPRRAARGAGPRPPTRCRPTAASGTRTTSRPSGWAARRPAGTDRERRRQPIPAQLIERSQPARRRSAQHQLRRRQHLRQGQRSPTR